MKNGKIEVVDYSPDWPKLYEEEIKLINKILSSEIIRAHHIGSTAVPYLAAKPTIDILLEVKDITQLDKYNGDMENLGYMPKGEFGIPGRRYYSKGEDKSTHHVHAFNDNSYEAKRHLAFRDYLIANPKIAEQYGSLKKQNAEKCNNNIDAYCKLKNNFVKYHEQKALDGYSPLLTF